MVEDSETKKESGKPTKEPTTIIVRQPLTRLRERVVAGENIHSVILSVLRTDYDILHKYWEDYLYSFVGRDKPSDLDPEIRELYDIQPHTLEVKTADDPEPLNFLGGFSLATNHWLNDVIIAKNQPEIDSNAAPIASTPQVIPEQLRDLQSSLMDELGIVRARKEQAEIKESLKADPTGVSWLKTKMKKGDPSGPWEPTEQQGIEAAITGVGKLYGQLTANSINPAPPQPLS